MPFVQDSASSVRNFKVVGSRPVRPDGVDKVTGRAKYGADLSAPGMLIGRVLRSPHAHARIKNIDTSKALAAPGVKAVATAADFGSVRRSLRDVLENCLAQDKALYEGHAVADGVHRLITYGAFDCGEGAGCGQGQMELYAVGTDPLETDNLCDAAGRACGGGPGCGGAEVMEATGAWVERWEDATRSPTAAPTAAPTEAPTEAPTSAAALLSGSGAAAGAKAGASLLALAVAINNL